jgi:ech hydrogenase subunit E
MAQRTVIPFGPQHPALPEPIHLDLVLEDETVVEVVPSLGFVHRGLELLSKGKTFEDMVYVAERICGICSFIHCLTYCRGIEKIMNIELTPRARYLRVFWSELSRIHSHLLWLGLAADAAGFESLFMHAWRVREKILDIIEETAGGRVIFGACKIGGTCRDVTGETLGRITERLAAIENDYRRIADVFKKDYTIRHRFSGIGVLGKDDAYILGAVGPTARGSGIVQDMRKLGYAAYGDIPVETITERDGDCYARGMVRVREVFVSFDLLRRVIEKIPEGAVSVPVKGFPDGEYFSRTEQPRGEVLHYVKGNGTKFLDRFRVRTPTFANVPALIKMLTGCALADVPVIVSSIDPCIGCAER